jgi:hypothetical protein
MPLQQKRVFYFLLSAALGFLLWYLSPELFDKRIPWNGNILHYGAALVTIGLAVRLLMMALPLSVYYGVVGGQFLGALYPHFELAHLLPLTGILIFLFSLLAYFGAWFGQHIR